MAETSTPVEVFCCYSHADEMWLRKLETHLSLLKRQGLISLWHDRLIAPGTDWVQAIDTHLNRASVILLLISSDFLASNYCSGTEMERALDRHRANEARVIPILLRTVAWKDAPFAHLQALPTDAKPITSWSNPDEAFADVAAGIRQAIEGFASLSPSLPRAASLPVSNVPYPRNTFFTGREDILSRLRTRLKADQATELPQPQALSGLGGIGKTQIALEYAYRYQQDYQAVLWARAESREALISSYMVIADEWLKLPEREAQDQTIVVQAVKTWLQTHRQWLLILDNADELTLLPEFLPPVLGGHVLLTTRASALGHLAQRIEVETLLPEQGAVFLLRRASLLAPDASLTQATVTDRELAIQISKELGGLPLALDQAGAYLEETGSDLSEYRQTYQRRQSTLLGRRGQVANHPERVADHPESVATTWSLSFEQVEQKSPAAADLLRLCTYLAPDAIAEEIITQGAPHLESELGSTTADSFLLNQAIEILRASSLLQRNVMSRTLSMHRLVQTVLRDTMEAKVSRYWMERAVYVVNAAFPDVEFAQWTGCERCLPHVLICAQWIEQEQMAFPEAIHLLNRAGYYLNDRARYAQAESLLVRTLSICEKQWGPEHPDTIQSLNALIFLYQRQGKYAQAEPLLVRALSICEQQWGPRHPYTVQSFNSLASHYEMQCKYEQAELLYKQQWGPERPYTVQSLNGLASLYEKQGKYKQAEPLLVRALSICKQHWGPEHLNTTKSLNSLALLYTRQGKYEQAEPLYKHAFSIYEQELGTNHPDVAESLDNLAGLYEEWGRYAQAEPLHVRALSIYEQQLGPGHFRTVHSIYSLAYAYEKHGKYAQAEPLRVSMHSIYEQQWGPEHPKTAESLDNLARLYEKWGKYAQAEPLYLRALSIYEQQLGPGHPDTVQSLNSLAYFYKKQSKYAQAEPLYLRAHSIREQQWGPEHPETVDSFDTLIYFYEKQGKYEQAEPLRVRALSICEQQWGPEHPKTAESLDSLAYFYEEQGKYAQAEPLYLRVLSICEQQWGPEHPETVKSLNTLASLYKKQGKYVQAEPLYQQTLSICEQQLENYASLLKSMGRDREAARLEILAQFLKWSEKGNWLTEAAHAILRRIFVTSKFKERGSSHEQ